VALERHLEELMSELARTEARDVQHELAIIVEDLEAITKRLPARA
jgi:hypothetical protein